MASLRQRNRHRAMRETQRAAIALFLDRGFLGTTVEEIADQVGMAPSTIFRHFGTKEDLVLWDEHDVALEEALGDRLRRQPPLDALRDAFIETMASRYDADLSFQLARVKFIFATEALHAAAVESELRARAELTHALRKILPRKDKDAASVLVGAVFVALDVAMNQWQASDAKKPLGALLRGAFDALTRLDSLGRAKS